MLLIINNIDNIIMKNIYCLIGITLFLTNIFMFFPNMKSKKCMALYNKLNKEQKTKYIDIVRERIIIYSSGVIIALILASLYYFNNESDDFRLCKTLSIFTVVKLIVYYFAPKKPSITYSLTTKEQLDTWQDIGSEMRSRWKKSLILGFITYCIIAYSRK